MASLENELEVRKLQLEEAKFAHAVELEERTRKASRSTQFWTRIGVVLPLVALVLGQWIGYSIERSKNLEKTQIEVIQSKRQIIDRQLSELYYPMQIRLEVDTAVWTLSKGLALGKENRSNIAFSRRIQTEILIPNHLEIVSIINNKFGLLWNSDERPNELLLNAIRHYQRHVAAFRTLRAVQDFTINTPQLCEGCDFPRELPPLIASRILALQKQQEELSYKK